MITSVYFSLAELTDSDYATRHGIDNTPKDPDVLANLGVLADGLSRVRIVLAVPISISSGYRCPKLNTALRGAPNSQHMQGLAADIKLVGYQGTLQDACETVIDNEDFVDFDQLILEGSWIHVSFSDSPRREVLTAHFNPGQKATYTKGLPR